MARMEGFIVTNFQQENPQALKELAQWLAEGKIKNLSTVIKGGPPQAEHTLRGLFKGLNTDGIQAKWWWG